MKHAAQESDRPEKMSLAFGVDPTRREPYSLRQSRYEALAGDLERLAADSAKRGRKLRLLDIGVNRGLLKRYVEARPHAAATIELYGADIKLHTIYKQPEWAGFWIGDLTQGLPEIPENAFDIVVCEQVLEHLPEVGLAMATLERLLRPGGTLFVGVPTFPHGLHLARRHLTPLVDRLLPPGKVRGHLQAFSRRTFVSLLHRHTKLEIKEVRGFRIVSGGILRPLEHRRSWWRFNRWIGKHAPGLCIEIQVVARKRGGTDAAAPPLNPPIVPAA